MIRILIFILMLLMSFVLQAQEATLAIKGKVVDSRQEVLAFVTVIAKDHQGNVVTSFYTDEQGVYQLNTQENIQQLEFSYVGFQTQVVFGDVSFPSLIELKEDNALLDEVVIKAKKPTIKREIDRLVFNVQDTPLATTNAWDIVKQTPGVNAIGDNLSIRGSQSILVTINDKKVMLSGEQLKALLEGTEGTQVEAIEVITNPPAKYEAQGNAVLNIKLKKNNLLGYKGSIGERFKQTTYAYNTLSTQHTYTGEKINVSGSYSLGQGTSVRYNEDNVFYENGDRWSSVMTRKNKIKGQHSFQAEMDIKLDTTLTLTVGGNGYINVKTKGNYEIPTSIYNPQNKVESSYTTFNDKRSNMDTYTGYALVEKKFSPSKNLLWSSYFTYDKEADNQDVLTKLNFKEQPESARFFGTKDRQRTRLAVSGIDYSVDKESTKWELGGKYSIVKANYLLDFFDEEQGGLLLNSEKSNVFDYQEINWAAYTSYTKQWKKWQAKVGVRGEYTGIQTKSTGMGSNNQSYFKLFPTAYLKYDLTDQQQLSLSYSKRIDRPSYSWMNPAKSYYNLFSYFQGDPDLKAAISHNFSLNYTFNELNIEFFYNRELNPSMEISYQENESNMLIYHYTNIDKRQLVGMIANYSYQILPRWSVSSFTYLQQQEDYFYGVDQQLHKNDAFVFGGRVTTTVNLDKVNNWKAMLTYNFYTPTVQGSFKISGYQRTDFIMSREFNQKKWSANLYVYNIFGSDRQIIKTQYANQYNYFKDYMDTQGIAIGLRYNFGNQKVKYSSKELDMQEKDRL
ncbi:TonB-dependent receptor [Myroides sp. 1354]|uniref:outer membrane beta-barrel family protein n=1 Tax=unclassified Myroides TaxID=2642485 RepID=UPI002577F9F4|nr:MULTISPECIES: outer membrane beta-barrel family protein [unclassified Myroides]MDM1046379.1 TonB-dependent receptor [Myroides sp. R163-1]MDM1057316.1 TonB-dependent receptor [Myroides sp. 1354]MDM1070564.1 TonB-dependent receptor [Myroides sp. 1372]